jgi:hypothetical protein
MCSDHWSEYQRDYRKRSDTKRDKAAHFRGFEEGVLACRNLLRQMLGDRTVSGHQAAQIIERHISGAESQAIVQQRALVASISTGPRT